MDRPAPTPDLRSVTRDLRAAAVDLADRVDDGDAVVLGLLARIGYLTGLAIRATADPAGGGRVLEAAAARGAGRVVRQRGGTVTAGRPAVIGEPGRTPDRARGEPPADPPPTARPGPG